MTKQASFLVGGIMESIRLIEEYVQGIGKDEFSASPQIQDAVIRRLEIIGEAVKALPAEIKVRSPDVAWSQIARMRDVLIHKYFGVDLQLVWDSVNKDLPKLKKELTAIEQLFKRGGQ